MALKPIRVPRPAVHPHVCGEHLGRLNRFVENVGSSPRVWGTYDVLIEQRLDKRFIPTCVGNMGQTSMPAQFLPVHPHVCGEHLVFREPVG